MSDYVIITDTSADIPADILDKGQIHLIPMVYQLNGVSAQESGKLGQQGFL